MSGRKSSAGRRLNGHGGVGARRYGAHPGNYVVMPRKIGSSKNENPLYWPNATIARLIDCIDCPAVAGENCPQAHGLAHKSRVHRARRMANEAYEQVLRWKERCEH